MALTACGRSALATGDHEGAVDCLKRADAAAAHARAWDETADVALYLGKAFAGLGKLRFAALHLRTALDVVERVARSLQSERDRQTFLDDPRRRALFDALSELDGRTGAPAAPPTQQDGMR